MTIWDAKVTPPPTPDELMAMSPSELLWGLHHEYIFVCGGANARGELITEETVACRNALYDEIARRLEVHHVLKHTAVPYEALAQ